jgi:hypothetical protein
MEHFVGSMHSQKTHLAHLENVIPNSYKLFLKTLVYNSYNLIICVENENGYTYLWFYL